MGKAKLRQCKINPSTGRAVKRGTRTWKRISKPKRRYTPKQNIKRAVRAVNRAFPRGAVAGMLGGRRRGKQKRKPDNRPIHYPTVRRKK